VMRESAQAALSFARSRYAELGTGCVDVEKQDIHVHVPAGGVPKDGPSAGITIATALTSALTQRPVARKVAMTGEITLRGRVLPVGGIKEKVLAAHRAGIKTFVMPARNRVDLDEVPAGVRKNLDFVFVNEMREVISVALAGKPQDARILGSKVLAAVSPAGVSDSRARVGRAKRVNVPRVNVPIKATRPHHAPAPGSKR